MNIMANEVWRISKNALGKHGYFKLEFIFPVLFVSFLLSAVSNDKLSCCRYFNIASNLLPEIHSSSEIYGHIKEDPLKGIPISAVSFFSSVEGVTVKLLEQLVVYG
jgi:hypothetical protein